MVELCHASRPRTHAAHPRGLEVTLVIRAALGVCSGMRFVAGGERQSLKCASDHAATFRQRACPRSRGRLQRLAPQRHPIARTRVTRFIKTSISVHFPKSIQSPATRPPIGFVLAGGAQCATRKLPFGNARRNGSLSDGDADRRPSRRRGYAPSRSWRIRRKRSVIGRADDRGDQSRHGVGVL